MQRDNREKVMVVVLEDMVNQSIPRILAIRRKVLNGGLLNLSELGFFTAILKRLGHCHHHYAHDSQCLTIFACISHMMYKIINRAHENEQKSLRSS